MDPTPDVVTVRDLSRSPGRVLDRVVKGERLVVARHGRPIATLQPLSGAFFEPRAEDEALATLTMAQKELLVAGVRQLDRLVPVGLDIGEDGSNPFQGLRDLVTEGLAKRTERGTVLTGRGHILRERLLAQRGVEHSDGDRRAP